MTDKLLHVSCLVRDGHIYELLRALEMHKAGNVEVRPVAPREEQLALPAPTRAHSYTTGVAWKVRAAMELKKQIRVTDLARELGMKPPSVLSAVTKMIQKGLAKRIAYGVYMRVKPDPELQQLNGKDTA